MTDKEIIKALECCTTKGAKCSDCPAFKKVDRSDCKKYFRGAIDIINRQQAEIERLNNNISAMVVTLRNSAKATRNEAIKEFAESLNENVEKARQKYQRLCREQGEKEDEIMEIHFKGIIKLINNLVKEKEKGR